jgi:hypothetical protein
MVWSGSLLQQRIGLRASISLLPASGQEEGILQDSPISFIVHRSPCHRCNNSTISTTPCCRSPVVFTSCPSEDVRLTSWQQDTEPLAITQGLPVSDCHRSSENLNQRRYIQVSLRPPSLTSKIHHAFFSLGDRRRKRSSPGRICPSVTRTQATSTTP